MPSQVSLAQPFDGFTRIMRFDNTDKTWALGLIDPFVREFKGRLLPAFANIVSESDKVAEEYYLSYPGSEYGDLSDAAEAAWEKGFTAYEDLEQVKQQLVQLSVAALYFFWERTVKNRMEFYFEHSSQRTISKEQLRRANLEEIRKACCDAGLVPFDFDCYDQLDELRLVTNTVKHAEGDSCEKLSKRRRELFERPGLVVFAFGGPYAEDLYLEEKHFDEYAEAVRRFWIDVVELP